MMKKIVFISGNTKTGNLLRTALKSNGFEIIEPNLTKMTYYSTNEGTVITSDGVDISDATHMLCRSVSSNKSEIYRLAMALECNGCLIVDGIDRLRRSIGDKSTSSLERTQYQGGIPTYIPNSPDSLPMNYPVIVKPINGKYCRGVKVCKTYDEYTDAYYKNEGEVIVQQYIPFEHECRVLVVNLPGDWPKIVYVASKRNVARKGTKRKATFVPNYVREAMTKAIMTEYCAKRQGIVGYDIGLDDKGETYIIEANYSPRFDRAEDRLDMDVADKVVKLLIK
jgi:glutathione synthase/RimK-type ligase-like ATP-grasp enzyme